MLMTSTDSIFFLFIGIVGFVQFQLPRAPWWQEMVIIFSLIHTWQITYASFVFNPFKFQQV